jgi:hypothetical protein
LSQKRIALPSPDEKKRDESKGRDGQGRCDHDAAARQHLKQVGAADDADDFAIMHDQNPLDPVALHQRGKQQWASPSESNIVVPDGVVHFWGSVGSEKKRTALRVLAENIPCVRGIEDHMISGPRHLSPLFPAP